MLLVPVSVAGLEKVLLGSAMGRPEPALGRARELLKLDLRGTDGMTIRKIFKRVVQIVGAIGLALISGRAGAASVSGVSGQGRSHPAVERIAETHRLVFEAYQMDPQRIAAACEQSVSLFAVTERINPVSLSQNGPRCRNASVSSLLTELGELLVLWPREIIETKASELFKHDDRMIAVFKGKPYVELKHFLRGMMDRPLSFWLVEPPREECDSASGQCDRVRVGVQLASDLLGLLERLGIESEAAQLLRDFGVGDYQLVAGRQAGDLRVERLVMRRQLLAGGGRR